MRTWHSIILYIAFLLTLFMSALWLLGCGGGTASYAGIEPRGSQLKLEGTCMFLKKVEHGFILDCQGTSFFLETDYAEPVKYWDEFRLSFVFEPVEDGLYVLTDAQILTHYSW